LPPGPEWKISERICPAPAKDEKAGDTEVAPPAERRATVEERVIEFPVDWEDRHHCIMAGANETVDAREALVRALSGNDWLRRALGNGDLTASSQG